MGGTALRLVGTVLVGLEPVVFLVGGVYAGAAYGGSVSALNPRPVLIPALVRSSVDCY